MNAMTDFLTSSEYEIGGDKCCCRYENAAAHYDKVYFENENVNDYIRGILDSKNTTDWIAPVLKAYLKQTLVFSSDCLKVYLTFLLDMSKSQNQKEHVLYILREQVELHPSCCEYVLQTYAMLFLKPQEEYFKKLTVLDYVLSQLENTLSPRKAKFSMNRTSRRSCKQKEDSGPTKEESLLKDILFDVLDILTDVLTHDLRARLNRREPLMESLLAKLVYKGDSDRLQYKEVVYKVFEVYKLCTNSTERKYATKLLELMATMCLRVDQEQNEANLLRLGSCSRRFVADFLVHVFGASSHDSVTSDVVTCLSLDWLRYHAAHFLLEKLCEKRFSSGLKGVTKELCSLLRSVQNSSKKMLGDANPNQILINTENREKKSAKMPTPLVCKLMTVVACTTIHMVNAEYFLDKEKTIQHIEILMPVLKELSQTCTEFTMLSIFLECSASGLL